MGLVTRMFWCSRIIQEIKLGAKLEIWCPVFNNKDKRSLASPSVPHTKNFIQLRVQVLPLVHGEGGGGKGGLDSHLTSWTWSLFVENYTHGEVCTMQ